MIINRYNKQREYGFAGALIAFSIFAFASYPLRIPAFISLISYLLIYSFKNIKKVQAPICSNNYIPEKFYQIGFYTADGNRIIERYLHENQ